MKKQLFVVVAGFLLVVGCNKSGNTPPENEGSDITQATQRNCGAYEVLQEQLRNDPSQRQRMEAIEEFTRRVEENPNLYRRVNGVIEIPVIVNVLYKTAAENISVEQIRSQITALNLDFSARNADYNLTSTYNSVKSGDIEIRFVIENESTDINRKETRKRSWQLNDAMKKESMGGINATSPETKLNIWVCNLASGYLGYAQFPGGPLATDGIVVDDNAFGTTGTAEAPFHKGRTATHEVGHWLNLRHIWGDATCGSDGVNDTPTHNTANYGCPAAGHTSTCAGNPIEMTMNYMDYTDDACMYMFTLGQKSRMLSVFAPGGFREAMAL